VRRAADNAADMDRARKLGFLGSGDVVLTHLASAPAGDVEEFVIHRQVDVVTSGGTAPKP